MVSQIVQELKTRAGKEEGKLMNEQANSDPNKDIQTCIVQWFTMFLHYITKNN